MRLVSYDSWLLERALFLVDLSRHDHPWCYVSQAPSELLTLGLPLRSITTIAIAWNMTLSDDSVLPALYDALATPPLSPTTLKRPPFPHLRTAPHFHPTPLLSPINLPPTFDFPLPSGSLMPAQFHTTPNPLLRRPTLLTLDTDVDSLTREKKGSVPALSHLLSVGGGGRVLSLAVDGRYVYAGCQSAENEITVSEHGGAGRSFLSCDLF